MKVYLLGTLVMAVGWLVLLGTPVKVRALGMSVIMFGMGIVLAAALIGWANWTAI